MRKDVLHGITLLIIAGALVAFVLYLVGLVIQVIALIFLVIVLLAGAQGLITLFGRVSHRS